MKVLVATHRTQGARSNDFAWTTDGELVTFGITCDTDGDDPDGDCGCGRAFAGLNSMRATTTAEISDLEMSRADMWLAVEAYMQQAGYLSTPLGTEDRADLDELVQTLLYVANHFPVGTVLGRRLDQIVPR